jgi:hypothetical protein
MSEEIVARLRTLQPAAKVANDLAAVSEIVSKLMDIVPLRSGVANPPSGPLTVLAALPLLERILPEIKGLRVQRGDESVSLEWDAEIELADGIRFGEGNSPAGAILCATIEILSAIEKD